MNRGRLRRVGVLLAAWLVVALPVTALLFVNSEQRTTVAGHEATVSPTFDGYATLDLGPYLPKLRYPSGGPLGAYIDFGKTTLTSYEALINRYTVIGAQPQGEIAKVTSALEDVAVDSAVGGALVGLAGPALYLLLGSRRRAELARHVTLPRAAVAGLAVAVGAVAVLQPWNRRDAAFAQEASDWRPIAEELPDVPIPPKAQPLEVESGLFTSGTKRIAESLMDSYAKGTAFYDSVVERLPEVADQIRQPEEGDTVALLVSDRHDNVGMDKVARAIADAGGATVLLAAGDDTSTGSTWEAFSLDSLDQIFDDYDHRFAITGNHDHGEFVGDYLGELGFTRPDGEAVEGPDDIRILGADDPRSSGLGSWRDETGLSFREHAELVADQACEYDEQGERISTLLTHDANTGRYALRRGCVDLVVGGHVHEQLGPTEYLGDNGKIGYSFTNGTTGGAAYAIAIGSKLRRNAMVTLVTYRDGRPIGVQPVTVRTVGDFRVEPFIALDPAPGDQEGEDLDELTTPETTNGPGEDETS
ncbi:MAG TPA: metallophosphoesterase [Nocardioidaceae bacterium]